MISDKARELFQTGEMREAITRYRYALRFETDAFERAKIYLDLARIYRIRVRMKNAHLELRRAFACIGMKWPENTIGSLLLSVMKLSFWPSLRPDFERRSLEDRTSMITALYEEVGLSAYYLRQTWTLIQATVRARKPCHDMGPSLALLNWYGGTACIFAIIDLNLRSLIPWLRAGRLMTRAMAYLQRCYDTAARLDPHKGLGKAMIWEGLLREYKGDPMGSAEIFERCLQDHGKYLEPFDIRMAAITLSINYLSRGHFQKSMDALNRQAEYNPALRLVLGGTSFDDVPWYSLGPRAMLGELKEMDRLIRIFSSVMTVDKDEKWLLAQYLGELLIAGRKVGMNYSQAEDLISRFEMLGMGPRQTHSETGFYWLGEAYIRFSFALRDRAVLFKFKRSLKRLGQLLPHPAFQSHYAVLKAGLAWLEGNDASYKRWADRAFEEARAIDNQWALLELDGLRLLTAPAGANGGNLAIH